MLGACSRGDEADDVDVTIGVAAAPSLAGTFNELIGVFEDEHPGVRVHLELGRSNDTAEGLGDRSDVHVFASASDDAMGLAVDRGTAVDPEVFARNHVVLAVPSGNPADVTGLDDLGREELRVGLCEPEVPCGAAADVLLDAADVAPSVDARDGGSRALSARLSDNELDAGIVYRTDVAGSHGWVTRVRVSERESTLSQEAGATRYSLARVPGGEDPAHGGEAEAEAERRAGAEFRSLVTSGRGYRALENAGLQPITD